MSISGGLSQGITPGKKSIQSLPRFIYWAHPSPGEPFNNVFSDDYYAKDNKKHDNIQKSLDYCNGELGDKLDGKKQGDDKKDFHGNTVSHSFHASDYFLRDKIICVYICLSQEEFYNFYKQILIKDI